MSLGTLECAKSAGLSILGYAISPFFTKKINLFYSGQFVSEKKLSIGQANLNILGAEEKVLCLDEECDIVYYSLKANDFSRALSSSEIENLVFNVFSGEQPFSIAEWLRHQGVDEAKRGVLIKSLAQPGTRRTALLFLGVGSTVETTGVFQAILYLALGYDVLVYNYPGYAKSTGRPSSKTFAKLGVRAAEQFQLENPGSPRPVVMGYSIGGTAAANAATAVQTEILVLLNSFAYLQACPYIGPFQAGAITGYGGSHNNAKYLESVKSCKALLIHTEGDEIVGNQTQQLCDALSHCDTTVLRVPCQSHETLTEAAFISMPQTKSPKTRFFSTLIAGALDVRFDLSALSTRQSTDFGTETEFYNHCYPFYLAPECPNSLPALNLLKDYLKY